MSGGEPFRAVFNGDPVSVLGYRMTFNRQVDVQGGAIKSYFLALFYVPMTLGTPSGHVITTGPSFMVFQPGAPIFMSGKGPWKRSWVRLPYERGDGLLAESGLTANRPYSISNVDELDQYIIAMYEEMTHPKGRQKHNVMDLLKIWMRSICRDSEVELKIDPNIQAAREYLEQRFMQKINFPNLASKFGFSKSAFYAKFRTAYQDSPHTYLTRIRLNHAEELLSNREFSATEVAHLCGFSDLSHFSKTMKKQIGLNPSEFMRKKYN